MDTNNGYFNVKSSERMDLLLCPENETVIVSSTRKVGYHCENCEESGLVIIRSIVKVGQSL